MSGLWRWRGNPLRRRTDLAEAWLALAAALLILLGGSAVGWATTRATGDALLESVRAQHAQRHLVWVQVDRLLPQPPVDPDPETATQRDAHRRVLATWRGVDGSRHLGPVAAPRPVEPGDRFRIWTDGRGRVMARPMDVTTANSHAVLAGLGAGALAGAAVEGGRRLALWRLMRRRYRRWDEAWERAGQDWGRAGAGS
ncbi:Rv1733c family protein [Streptomyces sclerotialus]|uniref:Rv1733c family protein n=1 Tax=Streptomyces sclerotialus TaxID=1957 RepID=UPI00099B7C2D